MNLCPFLATPQQVEMIEYSQEAHQRNPYPKSWMRGICQVEREQRKQLMFSKAQYHKKFTNLLQEVCSALVFFMLIICPRSAAQQWFDILKRAYMLIALVENEPHDHPPPPPQTLETFPRFLKDPKLQNFMKIFSRFSKTLVRDLAKPFKKGS